MQTVLKHMFGWPFSILSCFNYNLVVARIWFIMFLLVFFRSFLHYHSRPCTCSYKFDAFLARAPAPLAIADHPAALRHPWKQCKPDEEDVSLLLPTAFLARAVEAHQGHAQGQAGPRRLQVLRQDV